MRKYLAAIVSSLLFLGSAGLLHAQSFVALGSGGNSLSFYNTTSTAPVVVPITGLNSGDTLVNIDFFTSSNGQLYGMGTSGTLYRLSNTGVATVDVPNAIPGATAIDFNPVPNRLRVFAGNNNFRLTPGTGVVTNDGTFSYASGDPNAGATPNLVAAAYTNNFAGATASTLYSIDATLNTLVLHTVGPQFSTLNTVGTLTLNGNPFDALPGITGFDVLTINGINTAYLSSGNSLFTINLSNAVLTSVGTLSGPAIRDIAVVPEPSTYALLCIGAVGAVLLHRRRRQQAVGA
jgi:hypothetical protein